MFNVGSQELLVVLLLVFLLFGPRHIPGVAHALGKGLGDLRRAIEGIESNVRRAGGELPRFPRDLDDLIEPPVRTAMTAIEQPKEPEPATGQVPGPATSAPPESQEAGRPPGAADPPERYRGEPS